MKCPRCTFIRSVKDGIVKGRQRYKCKRCNYRYTVEEIKKGIPSHIKRVAIVLALEGYPLQKIGQELGVSHTAVANWLQADSLEALFEENYNRKQPVEETNKEGLKASLRDKQFERWLLVSWNSIASRVSVAKRQKPWEDISDNDYHSTLRAGKKGRHAKRTDVDAFREILNNAYKLADERARNDRDELRSALYTLTWLFEDVIRNVKVSDING